MEKISIPCPYCNKNHSYKLKIEYSIAMFSFVNSNLSSTITKQNFTKLFICPEKNEPFQSMITVESSSGIDKIGNPILIKEND